MAGAGVSRPNVTVHLEFFVEGGEGKVRITDDCTVRGYQTNRDYKTWDFRVEPGSGGYGGRKEASGSQDLLVLRGTIAETIRGVVGLVGSDGYIKRYYLDNRLLEGILPDDIWLQGKYIPTPAGWHDYRPGS